MLPGVEPDLRHQGRVQYRYTTAFPSLSIVTRLLSQASSEVSNPLSISQPGVEPGSPPSLGGALPLMLLRSLSYEKCGQTLVATKVSEIGEPLTLPYEPQGIRTPLKSG